MSEDFEAKRDRPPPPGVGSLNIRASKADPLRLLGYLSMPKDVLEPVLQMLIAGRFKFVLMDGERMRWHSCHIRHFEFTAQYNEPDYPEDD